MATPKVPPKHFARVCHRPSYVTNPSKVYFKTYRPLQLREELIGRDSHGKITPCVPLLLEMMDCLKRTGFIDSPCKQHIEAFKQCNEEFRRTEKVKQKLAEEDISLFKSTTDMKREQINLLLKNFQKKS